MSGGWGEGGVFETAFLWSVSFQHACVYLNKTQHKLDQSKQIIKRRMAVFFFFYQTLGLEFSMTFKYTMNNLVVAQTIISGHDG